MAQGGKYSVLGKDSLLDSILSDADDDAAAEDERRHAEYARRRQEQEASKLEEVQQRKLQAQQALEAEKQRQQAAIARRDAIEEAMHLEELRQKAALEPKKVEIHRDEHDVIAQSVALSGPHTAIEVSRSKLPLVLSGFAVALAAAAVAFFFVSQGIVVDSTTYPKETVDIVRIEPHSIDAPLTVVIEEEPVVVPIVIATTATEGRERSRDRNRDRNRDREPEDSGPVAPAELTLDGAGVFSTGAE